MSINVAFYECYESVICDLYDIEVVKADMRRNCKGTAGT